MICSASGTYSLPSARMKSYWVATSQKMTRGMPGSLPQDSEGNLSEDVGTCQQEGGKAKATGLSYSRSTTATSSQQFWRGHLAQSAHTLSGKCSFSARTKPSLRKNVGLRVSASTSAIPWARASVIDRKSVV